MNLKIFSFFLNLYTYGGFRLRSGRNQHNNCKAIIFQLKRNVFKKEREKGLQQAHKGEIGGGWREGTSTRGKIPDFCR